MRKHVILAQSDASANALKAWRELLSGESVLGPDLAPDPIIVNPASLLIEGGVQAYKTLVKSIGAITRLDEASDESDPVVVMVDAVRPSRLSAIAEGITWDYLIAMLVLTFPEIRWAFGFFMGNPNDWVIKKGEEVYLRFPKEALDLLSLFIEPAGASLFDPTGLREWVKIKTNEALAEMDTKNRKRGYQIPVRQELAAVIDEEPEFAFLHAYTAYRYGFRVDVITSWSLMQRHFGEQGKQNGTHKYSLLLEDMRLGFPDKPAKVHLSHLAERASFCPLLDDDIDKSKWRFLITTGQMGSDRDLMKENSDYLKRKISGRGGVLYKPLGGIADLWEKMGLYQDLSNKHRPGNAPGFIWPPSFSEEGTAEGHGSPGKLTLIATTLLYRANAIKKSAGFASEFIRGAVLALEAAELLCGKTPHTALSLITLRNELEARAECAFVGAGYHFSLETRLKELDAEVASITRWYHEEVRKRSTLAAKASILNSLVLVFNEAGRMEEEMKCLAALRRFNRKLSAPNNLNPLSWIIHAMLSYGEWLLASFPRLTLLTAFWLTAFVLMGWWLQPDNKPVDTTSNVILWFFGEPDTKDVERLQVLSWFVVLTGVFHVGVLIAYLYSLISRK